MKRNKISVEDYLKSIKRVNSVEEGQRYTEDVLLLPKNIDIAVSKNSLVYVCGLNDLVDRKPKDMLRIIEIEDAISVKYKETNVISPSIYVHNIANKPCHITTQAFLYTTMTNELKKYVNIEKKEMSSHYGRHEMDSFWLPCSKPLEQMKNDDVVCVFNRRVAGWDGSNERPVIELLGAGGHLQSVWDDERELFVSRTLEDNLKKEFSEELGLKIHDSDITCVGGFFNANTSELVILSCIRVDSSQIPQIQKYALNNQAEDTDGVYMCSLEEAISYYKKDPSYFAGGVSAAPYNFPNNEPLMERLHLLLLNKNI